MTYPIADPVVRTNIEQRPDTAFEKRRDVVLGREHLVQGRVKCIRDLHAVRAVVPEGRVYAKDFAYIRFVQVCNHAADELLIPRPHLYLRCAVGLLKDSIAEALSSLSFTA